jgi:hypothetical protein
MIHGSILSIDIDHGDLFLHFRDCGRVAVSAWNHRTSTYRYFIVSFQRGVSIAAKAMRAKRLVEPFSENAEAAR